jgi:hypothetical protein
MIARTGIEDKRSGTSTSTFHASRFAVHFLLSARGQRERETLWPSIHLFIRPFTNAEGTQETKLRLTYGPDNNNFDPLSTTANQT